MTRSDGTRTPFYHDHQLPRSARCPQLYIDHHSRRRYVAIVLLTVTPFLLDRWLAKCGTGIYKGGVFHFTFAINLNYPHEPPKVRCTQKVSVDSSSQLKSSGLGSNADRC